jgi:hypothetical protein
MFPGVVPQPDGSLQATNAPLLDVITIETAEDHPSMDLLMANSAHAA